MARRGDNGDRPKDLPWEELIAKVEATLRDPRMTVFVKFTCRGCGERQTFDTPNKLYTSGLCEECGYETSLVEHGGGALLIIRDPKEEDISSL